MKHKTSLFKLLFILLFQVTYSQEVNNLVLPEGTNTNSSGTFGHVEKVGHGSIQMILIADVGFGWDIYKNFMFANEDRYTMFAVTLPGSDSTLPLTMPEPKSSYSKRSGLNILQTTLLNFIENEKLDKPVIVGNLLISTWLALNTAVNYPEKISSVIIFGGMPYATWPSYKDTTGKTPVPMEERVPGVDYYTAPKLFKTITREQWLKNLFQPYQYANDVNVANGLYQKTTEVLIPVMVRYLCEFYTTDISLEFSKIKIPVLVLVPNFNEQYFIDNCNSKDKMYFQDEWDMATDNPNFKIEKIKNARLFLWHDQPKITSKIIKVFLKK